MSLFISFYLPECLNSFGQLSRRADPAHVVDAQNVLSDEEDNMTAESRGQSSSQAFQPCVCDYPGCDRVYNGGDGANSLRRHKREKHEGTSSWTCPFPGCLRVSSRQHNLRQHWVTSHAHAPLPPWLVPTKSKGGGGVSRKKAEPADRGNSAGSPGLLPSTSYQGRDDGTQQ